MTIYWPAPPVLDVTNLACGHGGRPLLSGISFGVRAGEILCLLGPNGVGKTTLFKTILRLLPALAGTIRLGGEDVAAWPARRFAAAIGYVPQAHLPPFPFTVEDVTVMGRAAHLGPFQSPSPADEAIARGALDALGIGHLKKAAYTEISGGERQLVLIARALAQRPSVLIMDEPTSNLDFGNQARVLEHVRGLAESSGLAVILTTHDPNQALLHGSRVAALDRDGALVVGAPDRVVTADYLHRTYGIRPQFTDIDRPDGSPARLCLATGVPRGERRATCASA